MLNNISEKFYKWANGWVVLILVALDMFFAGFVMPLMGGLMKSGTGLEQPLDVMVFATPDKIFEMIERYGESTRIFYRNVELTADIAYPIIYTLAFGLLISWLFKRGFASNSNMRKYNVAPVFAFVFDMLENLNIVTLLSIFPSKPVFLAWTLFVFTTIKWLFAAVSIVLILIGLVMAIKNKFKIQE
ncbi:MAG: hypothetical protein KF758_17540 [Anaerolineales bacterium]|nr:hypothetical protein [Anaerolineales bacterium]MBX3038719.1 hypothetical protein [Anaerolineales bacterium]